MICKFAGFYCNINPLYDYTLSMIEKFRYEGDIPADVEIIQVGKNFTVEDYKKYQKTQPHLELDEIEHMFLAEDFFKRILKYNSIMLHSSALKYNGKCYLFSAKSGVGKSTHTCLWEKIYGDKVKVINDDKPILKYENNKIVAYGTPFAGGTHKFLDESGQVDSIIFINRSENNSIKEISIKESIPLIFGETIKKLGVEKMNYALDMIDKICRNVRIYQLNCNMEDSAAILAHDTLIKE